MHTLTDGADMSMGEDIKSMADPFSAEWAFLKDRDRASKEHPRERASMLGHPLAEAVDEAQRTLDRASRRAREGLRLPLPIPLSLPERGLSGTTNSEGIPIPSAHERRITPSSSTPHTPHTANESRMIQTKTHAVPINSWGYSVRDAREGGIHGGEGEDTEKKSASTLPATRLVTSSHAQAQAQAQAQAYGFDPRTYKVSPLSDSWFFGEHDVRPELPASRLGRVAMWTQMLDRALHPRADPDAIEAQFDAGAWDARMFLERSKLG